MSAEGVEVATPLEAIVEEAPMLQPHSPSPEDDERNREYLYFVALLLATIQLKRR